MQNVILTNNERCVFVIFMLYKNIAFLERSFNITYLTYYCLQISMLAGNVQKMFSEHFFCNIVEKH